MSLNAIGNCPIVLIVIPDDLSNSEMSRNYCACAIRRSQSESEKNAISGHYRERSLGPKVQPEQSSVNIPSSMISLDNLDDLEIEYAVFYLDFGYTEKMRRIYAYLLNRGVRIFRSLISRKEYEVLLTSCGKVPLPNNAFSWSRNRKKRRNRTR